MNHSQDGCCLSKMEKQKPDRMAKNHFNMGMWKNLWKDESQGRSHTKHELQKHWLAMYTRKKKLPANSDWNGSNILHNQDTNKQDENQGSQPFTFWRSPWHRSKSSLTAIRMSELYNYPYSTLAYKAEILCKVLQHLQHSKANFRMAIMYFRMLWKYQFQQIV